MLAFGIGANAAVYSVFRGFAVRTIAVPHPEQLFRLQGGEASPGGKVTFSHRMSVPDYLDFRTRMRAGKNLAAFVALGTLLHSAESQRAVNVAFVSGNYFSTLRVRPILGRALTADEEGPTGAHPVALISEVVWRSDFGGRPDILGRTIQLGPASVTIVGVLPASFVGTNPDPLVRVWAPLGMYDAVSGTTGLLQARDFPNAAVFGRLAAGTSRAAVGSEASVIASSLNQEDPIYHQRFRSEVLDGSRLGRRRSDAARSHCGRWVSCGALLLVVHLIACSNGANLLLSRAIARRPEMATRLALGASRWQIVRQLLIESAALSTFAVVLGVALAFVAIRLLTIAPFLAAFDFHIDWPVLGVAVAVGVITALLFGLTPALEAARTNILGSLTGATAFSGGKRGQSPAGFVGVQLALSVALLATTALAVRVTRSAAQADPGYDVEHLMFINIELPDSSQFDPGGYAGSYDILRSGIAAIPGVRAVAEAQDVPLTPTQMRDVMTVPGYNYTPDEEHYIGFDNVSPGFFAAMGIPILRGRDFGSRGVRIGMARERIAFRLSSMKRSPAISGRAATRLAGRFC